MKEQEKRKEGRKEGNKWGRLGEEGGGVLGDR
jgi:hypothetical protein